MHRLSEFSTVVSEFNELGNDAIEPVHRNGDFESVFTPKSSQQYLKRYGSVEYGSAFAEDLENAFDNIAGDEDVQPFPNVDPIHVGDYVEQ